MRSLLKLFLHLQFMISEVNLEVYLKTYEYLENKETSITNVKKSLEDSKTYTN